MQRTEKVMGSVGGNGCTDRKQKKKQRGKQETKHDKEIEIME